MNVSEALGSGKLRPSQQLSNPGLVQAGRHPSHSAASVQEGQIYRQSTPGKLLEGQRSPPASTEDSCCHSGPGGIHSQVPRVLLCTQLVSRRSNFPYGTEDDPCLGPHSGTREPGLRLRTEGSF